MPLASDLICPSNEVYCAATNNYDAACETNGARARARLVGKVSFHERRDTIPLPAPRISLPPDATYRTRRVPLGQPSQRRSRQKYAKGRPNVRPFDGGSVPRCPMAGRGRVKDQSVGLPRLRRLRVPGGASRATGTSLYAFPTRFAVVTREVAKMLPVPTSSKELRAAPSPSPPPSPSVSSRSLSRYVAGGIGCYGTRTPHAEIMAQASVKPKVSEMIFFLSSNRHSCRHAAHTHIRFVGCKKYILDHRDQNTDHVVV